MQASLSIVVPVLDEVARIAVTLAALAPLRARGAEVIVVDGGSRDGTIAACAGHVDVVLSAPRGRARQMNAGARAAHGAVLLFLHADTQLPEGADTLIAAGLQGSGRSWGRFDVAIEGRSRWFTLIAAMMNTRSRWSGIATGDQAIFVTRSAFDAVGGYADQPLMEDVELSKRLKRFAGAPLSLRERVVTSGRRWERDGVWRTIVLMWRLRLLYALGVDAERLARDWR